MTESNQTAQKKSSTNEIKEQVIDKLAALITSAFGLVAALAWNSAIQKVFQTVFGTSSELYALIFYAVVVTVIAVIATVYIGRIAGRMK